MRPRAAPRDPRGRDGIIGDGVVKIPDGLRRLERSDKGRAWLQALPNLIEAALDRWSLRPGESFAYAYVSLAVPVTLADGADAVLKLGFPDRESLHEADALAEWGGRGAVRLLDHDRSLGALLVERCIPGTPLADVGPNEALDVLIDMLPRLWIPAAAPFTPLAIAAEWWASELEVHRMGAGSAVSQDLLTAALHALESLPLSQGDQVLVNRDLHTGNVLRSRREPWLVIDPKPLVGEREFGIAAIVRDWELGHSREAVIGRLGRLTATLGLDRERARLWTFAQTLASAFEGDVVLARHLDVARWLYEARP
jgi:streptomycin 6-kinase